MGSRMNNTKTRQVPAKNTLTIASEIRSESGNLNMRDLKVSAFARHRSSDPHGVFDVF